MHAALCPQGSGTGARALHAAFLALLPRIELHARLYFRGLRCPHRRDDAVAETVALTWRWFVRLVERGKDPLTFPTVLAAYAARAVRCGRRLCGQGGGKDVLSPLARQRHGFAVEGLPNSVRAAHDAAEDEAGVQLDAGQDRQEGGLQGSDGVGAGGGTGGGAHGDDLQRGTAPGPGRSGHGNPTAPGDAPAREGGAS